MELQTLRGEIDVIDKELLELFDRRLDVAVKIAACKQEHKLPVHDPAREREKLYSLRGAAREGRESYVTALCSLLFDISRAEQERLLAPGCELTDMIENALKNTANLFPERAVVACQGTEGAYSQLAAEKLFALPSIMYCATFDGVFAAVDGGLCAYGVLPLENSTAGSINQVYDLMMRYPFSIVRSARLKIDHCLLAKEGTGIKDIKEVFSHEQAVAQCAGFIKNLGCKVTVCENTAVAARMASASPRPDVAALSSRNCAALYGLQRLAESVQDQGNNYTRFICVAKETAIYPGADKTSLMLTIPHKPGSLYHILARFYIHNINLVKLESRPIPNRDFEFMFYFDLDTPVYSPALFQVLRELRGLCDEIHYLGSYSEVV
ncbi:MAG: chorismate mutase [Oscillospiraceae bacterium]|jgi:chorismate mutase/prephenate dehydratase|nr:chorismate mutase [Oscillospiraceae bacterium]